LRLIKETAQTAHRVSRERGPAACFAYVPCSEGDARSPHHLAVTSWDSRGSAPFVRVLSLRSGTVGCLLVALVFDLICACCHRAPCIAASAIASRLSEQGGDFAAFRALRCRAHSALALCFA
jgi:hypothetical protein